MKKLAFLSFFDVSERYPDAVHFKGKVGIKIIIQHGVDRSQTWFHASDLIYVYGEDLELVSVTERLVRERCSFLEWTKAKFKVLFLNDKKETDSPCSINIEGDFIDITRAAHRAIDNLTEEGATYEDYERNRDTSDVHDS